MTLGGLALAVGILVDDATVTIENINWHLEQGKDVSTAILDGAAADRHAGLRLAAVHLHRVRADVLPAGRRRLPVRADGRGGGVRHDRLVRAVADPGADHGDVPAASRTSRATRESSCEATAQSAAARRSAQSAGRASSTASSSGSSEVREGYRGLLALALAHRRAVHHRLPGFVVLSRSAWLPFLGANFFPSVDSGEITLHVRAPVGTRIEDTAALFDHIEAGDPPDHPAGPSWTSIVDNIGLPVSGINRAYSNTGGIGPQDGDIYITPERRTIGRRPDYVQHAARAAAATLSRARPSPSCPPTSSARS